MSAFSVGDKVRILKSKDGRFSVNHERFEDSEGVISKVDDSDNTVFVSVLCPDGTKIEKWFCQDDLKLIRKIADLSKCSCDGPEKIVMILFQPVRVCTACKKEKA
jgi:hypothetical protein